ncbi:MAG: MarR family transcriptional regulator [Chloroflexi bacterium]|nr:MarR family transcriptional regulator [Chloroflexota bacterium]
MTRKLAQLKLEFTESLSQISRFWGFPRGMGAIFAVVYLAPDALSLDEIAERTGLTKGAVSTEIRSLARLGLVHRSTRLGDRRDFYKAETDFFQSIRSILKERQTSEFDRALKSVSQAVSSLDSGQVAGDQAEILFIRERLRALQDFFNAIDSLANAVTRLETLGFSNVKRILSALK